MRTLLINRSIYSDKSIRAALEAYAGYTTATVEYTQQYAIVTFSECKYDPDQTVKEFENYMIGMENS